MKKIIGTKLALCLVVCNATLAVVWTAPVEGEEPEDDSHTQSHIGENYDFIIITPHKWKNDLEPLQHHKETKGIRTKLVGHNEIFEGHFFPVQGRDNSERIKYFIKNAKESWNIRYVMLVGSKTEMPVRYSVFHTHGELGVTELSFISDLYYADIFDESGDFCSWDFNNNSVFGEINDTENIDKVDLYPDIFIGRVLCNNSAEVRTVVNKIIIYENHTFG